LVLPILAAIAYPWLLAGITALIHAQAVPAPPSGGAVLLTTFAILACALSVMAVSAWIALMLAREENATATMRARATAHIAFASPSLLTGIGNIGGVLHEPNFATYTWPIFWIVMGAVVLLSPATRVTRSPSYHRKIVIAHGISASLILALFILPHIGNHLAGAWNGASHLQIMQTVRLLYRDEIVQPLLLGLIAFQIASGIFLVRWRLKAPADIFGTLQTLTGLYVGIYILGHAIAVFAARSRGIDTDWNWLTGHDRGILFDLSGSALVAHYWVGPIAIVTHVACGLRAVALEHDVSPTAAGRIVVGLFGIGVVASSAILAWLLGFHFA